MEKTFIQRLAELKAELHRTPIKESGINKHSGFTYFQIADYEPVLASLGEKYGIFHYFSFPVEHAELHVCDAFSDREIVTYCGYDEAQLKGCQPIQSAGAVQTYIRRYLEISFFGIVEADALDALVKKTDDDEPSSQPKPKAMVTAQPPKPAPATATQTPEQAEIKKVVTNNWGYVLTEFGFVKGGDASVNNDALSGAKAWLKRNIGIDNAGEIKSVDMLNKFQSAVDKLRTEVEAMKPKGPEAFEGDLL